MLEFQKELTNFRKTSFFLFLTTLLSVCAYTFINFDMLNFSRLVLIVGGAVADVFICISLYLCYKNAREKLKEL